MLIMLLGNVWLLVTDQLLQMILKIDVNQFVLITQPCMLIVLRINVYQHALQHTLLLKMIEPVFKLALQVIGDKIQLKVV